MHTKAKQDSGTKRSPIDWLFPKARKRVLSLLLTRPEEKWYLRDVARRTGCALGTVRRELAGLSRAEIAVQTRDGNRTYYQANRLCPVFAELVGLLRKTSGLADVLRDTLTPLRERIDVAFIYGSHASGDAKAASDVDVLFVGGLTFGDAVAAMRTAEESLGREVNPMVVPRDEFRAKVTERNHFLLTVLKQPKIFLLGDADDLAELVGQGPLGSAHHKS